MDWHLIAERPPAPVQVEVFFGDMEAMRDQNGNVCTLPPYRDMRRELGYWDGETFCELATGHSYFETWREVQWRPTHWRELPAPPTR